MLTLAGADPAASAPRHTRSNPHHATHSAVIASAFAAESSAAFSLAAYVPRRTVNAL